MLVYVGLISIFAQAAVGSLATDHYDTALRCASSIATARAFTITLGNEKIKQNLPAYEEGLKRVQPVLQFEGHFLGKSGKEIADDFENTVNRNRPNVRDLTLKKMQGIMAEAHQCLGYL